MNAKILYTIDIHTSNIFSIITYACHEDNHEAVYCAYRMNGEIQVSPIKRNNIDFGFKKWKTHV